MLLYKDKEKTIMSMNRMGSIQDAIFDHFDASLGHSLISGDAGMRLIGRRGRAAPHRTAPPPHRTAPHKRRDGPRRTGRSNASQRRRKSESGPIKNKMSFMDKAYCLFSKLQTFKDQRSEIFSLI